MDCDPRAGIGQIKSVVPNRLHFDLRTKNIRLHWLPSLPEPMHRRRSSIVPAIVFGGVAIGLAALGGEINLSGQDAALSVSPFLPGAATHETRADAQAASVDQVVDGGRVVLGVALEVLGLELAGRLAVLGEQTGDAPGRHDGRPRQRQV